MPSIADLLTGDEGTAQEKMRALQQSLDRNRLHAIAATLSGDKTLGEVGSLINQDYSQQQKMLAQVPMERQKLAVERAQQARLEASEAPAARHALRQSLIRYGMKDSDVPLDTPGYVMEQMAKQAEAYGLGQERLAAIREQRDLARQQRAALDQVRSDKQEEAAAKAFGTDILKSWQGRGSQAASLVGRINAAARLRQFALNAQGEGRDLTPQEMEALANEAGVLFTPGTAPHASFIKGLQTPSIWERGARAVSSVTGAPVEIPGSAAWTTKYAELADEQAKLAQEQLRKWLAIPMTTHAKYVQSHPEQAKNVMVNTLASFGIPNPEEFVISATGAVEPKPQEEAGPTSALPRATGVPVEKRVKSYY